MRNVTRNQLSGFKSSSFVVVYFYFFQFLPLSNYSIVKDIFSSSMYGVYRFQFMSHSNHVRDPGMCEVLQAIGVSISMLIIINFYICNAPVICIYSPHLQE